MQKLQESSILQVCRTIISFVFTKIFASLWKKNGIDFMRCVAIVRFWSGNHASSWDPLPTRLPISFHPLRFRSSSTARPAIPTAFSTSR